MILLALALAASATSGCTPDADLPRDYAGWARKGSTLDTGHSMTVTAGHGSAEASVTIRKAGLFGIAVDQPAWIDVHAGKGDRALRMASESKGPACSTIRKIVRYQLNPGTYRVTVTKMTGNHARLMLLHSSDAPAPGDKHRSTARYRRTRATQG